MNTTPSSFGPWAPIARMIDHGLRASVSGPLGDEAAAGMLRLAPLRDAAAKITDFTITAANAATTPLTGRSPAQLVGATLLETFPSAGDEGLLATYRAVAEGGARAEFEIYYAKDDVEDWFRVTAQRVGGGDLLITFAPITELRRLQRALQKLHEISLGDARDNEAYAERLIRLGCDVFGCAIGWHSVIEGDRRRVLAIAAPAPADHAFAVAAPQGRRDNLANSLAAAALAADGPELRHDLGAEGVRVFGADGPIALRYLGAPARVEGRLFGVLNFIAPSRRGRPYSQDEADLLSLMAAQLGARIALNEAETALRHSRDELKFVIDNIPARIWYKDEDDRLLRVNRAAAEAAGYGEPDALEGLQEHAVAPEREGRRQLDRKVLATGAPLRNQIERVRAATTAEPEIWVSTDRIPMTAPDRSRRLLVVSTDVSDLKAREQELERLNQSLKTFASIAAHDLQAPLRRTSMFVSLMRETLLAYDAALREPGAEAKGKAAPEERAPIPREVFAAIGSITENVAHMRQMVKSLYALSAVEGGAIKQERADLGALAREALGQLEETVAETGARVTIDPLPVVSGDGALLQQLFQNLIANACKYAGERTPEIRITPAPPAVSHTTKAEGPHRIFVEDHGLGVPAEAAEAIFEPFTRLRPATAGLGIGLSVCRRIAAAHGGALALDAAYRAGARFVLELPRSGAPQEAGSSPSDQRIVAP